MTENDPTYGGTQSFCGNCGTAVQAAGSACVNCGQELGGAEIPAEATPLPPADYVPYCRSCGTNVPWGESHSCQRCGVAPLCSEHFNFETGMCSDCTATEALAGVASAFDPATPPSGPWAQARPSVACSNCGARLRQGVGFCPQCGSQQAVVRSAAGTVDVEYMGFWVRVAAFLIDSVITGIAAGILGGAIGVPFLGSIISVLYFIIFTGIRGQTPGKMLMRIQVVNADGNIPAWTQVIVRELIGKIISGIVLLLGYLWVIWDPRKRGWHDYIAKTFVVRKEPSS